MTWMANWPRLLSVMTQATVFWELFYPVLVWRPLWRPVMLLGAVAVHAGLAIALGMITFGLVMLIGNMAFLSPLLVEAVVQKITRREMAEIPVAEPVAA
jgi:hypothetical protein